MSAQTNRGVPGIPLGALDAVSDENARQVLRSIVDGLNVRNGAAGKGDMAFVTRSELEQSSSGLSISLSNQLASYADHVNRITPGQINEVINDLQAQIMESKLFKDLGERVDLIDKPDGIFDRLGVAETVLKSETKQRIDGDTALSYRLDVMGTRVGNSEAAIKTETTQRVNADNAINQVVTTQYASVNDSMALLQTKQTATANSVAAMASTLNQVQAQVGTQSAAIAQEAQARASADGTLYAQWTLRVDVGGRVSGFGLASNQNLSDFIVRADRFSIASPSTQDGFAPQMPFIVLTTPQIVNGRTVPPGAYLRDAFIENGTITNAKIGAAEVDTLSIRGNAVTIPLFARGSSSHLHPANTAPHGELSVSGYFPDVCKVVLIAAVQANNPTSATNVTIKVVIDGSYTALWQSNSTSAGWTTQHTAFDTATVGPGWHTFELQLGNDWGNGEGWSASNMSLMVLGVAR